MWVGALGAHHGRMLTQYATAVAAEDRIRRRHDEAVGARRGRAARSPSKRQHRSMLRALTAGMTSKTADPAPLANKGIRPRLGQEIHTTG
jgi:hypothetical protein